MSAIRPELAFYFFLNLQLLGGKFSGHTKLFHGCRFLDIHVGVPQIYDNFVTTDITPQQCRLRDLTYSADIKVDIQFTKGKEVVAAIGKDGKGHTLIGKMPIMLRSDRCDPQDGPLLAFGQAYLHGNTLPKNCYLLLAGVF